MDVHPHDFSSGESINSIPESLTWVQSAKNLFLNPYSDLVEIFGFLVVALAVGKITHVVETLSDCFTIHRPRVRRSNRVTRKEGG